MYCSIYITKPAIDLQQQLDFYLTFSGLGDEGTCAMAQRGALILQSTVSSSALPEPFFPPMDSNHFLAQAIRDLVEYWG